MKEFSYLEIFEPVEQEGVIVRRDLMLTIGHETYRLCVATLQYIAGLRQYNEQFDEELRLDENILPIDSVSDLEALAKKLLEMSWEDVAPYLVKQKPDPREI